MILPLESTTGRGYGTSASLEPKASGLPWGYLASRDPFDRGGSKPKVQEAVRRGLLSAYQIDDPDPRTSRRLSVGNLEDHQKLVNILCYEGQAPLLVPATPRNAAVRAKNRLNPPLR